ncbi:hypothetical protein CEXT_85151, partial [Caerostris extrusa]
MSDTKQENLADFQTVNHSHLKDNVLQESADQELPIENLNEVEETKESPENKTMIMTQEDLVHSVDALPNQLETLINSGIKTENDISEQVLTSETQMVVPVTFENSQNSPLEPIIDKFENNTAHEILTSSETPEMSSSDDEIATNTYQKNLETHWTDFNRDT